MALSLLHVLLLRQMDCSHKNYVNESLSNYGCHLSDVLSLRHNIDQCWLMHVL